MANDGGQSLEDSWHAWLELLQSSGSTNGPAADVTADAQVAVHPRVQSARRCLQLLDELWPVAADRTVGDSKQSADGNNPLDHRRSDELLNFEFSVPMTGDARPKRFSRFLIHERLGRGGHGFVFRAHDPVLNRDVALKIPRPDSLASAELRRRFVEEAQVLARLKHTNLVSILEAGTVGPVCYLVMPFCPGPTLADWIVQQEKPIAFALAARMVRDLAATVDYVHSRGILHRDIKPSNVLLDPLEVASGESAGQISFVPKLNDFGLAKQIANTAEHTATGAVLGTPTYMAPEQAEGRMADVGVATDVYALGATLYELLTGQPPFRGSSELHTLRLISEGHLMPPRRLRANTPPDLEEICLKCLELEPSRRYHSARDLGDDLTAFIEQRPVGARPCGLLTRAVKWSRRRPLVATLAASLLLSLALGLGLAGWQWLRAESHRESAEENFRMAHGAVKQFHELMFLKDDYDTPELMPLRKDVLQTALPYYDRLLAQHTASREIRADVADVYYQLGHVALSSDLPEKGLELYLKAADLRRELATEEPSKSEHREYLARCYQRVGSILHQTSESSDAIDWLQKAAATQHELIRQHPQQMGVKLALAETQIALVAVYLSRDDLKSASDRANEAIELCSHVPQQSDALPSTVQRCLADAHLSSARVRSAAGDKNGAIAAYRHAADLQQQLVSQDLEMPVAASQLSSSLLLLASLHAKMGDDEQAVEQFGQAVAVLEKVAARYPSAIAYQQKLAKASHAFAAHHRKHGCNEDALRLYQQAANLWERLLKNRRENARLRYDLICAYYWVAKIERSLEHSEEATAALTRGIELFQELSPEMIEVLSQNRNMLCHLFKTASRMQTAAGHSDAAAKSWERAIVLPSQLLDESEETPAATEPLAN